MIICRQESYRRGTEENDRVKKLRNVVRGVEFWDSLWKDCRVKALFCTESRMNSCG